MTVVWTAALLRLVLLAAPPPAAAEIAAASARLQSVSEDERSRGMEDLVELAWLISVGARAAPANSARDLLATVAAHLDGVAPEHRAAVVGGLGSVYDEAALDLLLVSLRDRAPGVRRKAAEVLLKCAKRYSQAPTMPDQFSSAGALSAATDTDPTVRRTVRCVLRIALRSMEDDADRPQPGPVRDRLVGVVGEVSWTLCTE